MYLLITGSGQVAVELERYLCFLGCDLHCNIIPRYSCKRILPVLIAIPIPQTSLGVSVPWACMVQVTRTMDGEYGSRHNNPSSKRISRYPEQRSADSTIASYFQLILVLLQNRSRRQRFFQLFVANEIDDDRGQARDDHGRPDLPPVPYTDAHKEVEQTDRQRP